MPKKVAGKKVQTAKPRSFKPLPSATDGRPASIVGVGASAGGLEAFEQLLAALPNTTGMAFVLVQHLAPKHESLLSELLARTTKMPVIEVKQGMAVKANHVYVIPPNDLRIRRFTPMAEKIMNLIPADIGRPVTDIKPNVKIPDLKQLIARVLDSLEIQENQVEDNQGRWYSMKVRPYRSLDNKIDGVVIIFFDLDARLRPKT